MRGTKKSGGNFTIWHSDAGEKTKSQRAAEKSSTILIHFLVASLLVAVDGQITIDWIASQKWSSGSVLSFGASADGLASYTLLDTHPEALDAQFIIFSSSQGYPIIYPGGAYRESLATNWMEKTVFPDTEAQRCISEIFENEQPNPWWEVRRGPHTHTDRER